MKKIVVGFLITSLVCLTAQATNLDVHGKGDKFIKVTEYDSGQAVNFKLCITARPNQCSPIGKREYYYKTDLVELRNSETWDVIKSVGVGATILAATAYLGSVAAMGLSITVGEAATYSAMILGTGAGVALNGTVDILNPVEQYRQLETLERKVLNDETIFVKCTSEVFAKRLAAVLDNL